MGCENWLRIITGSTIFRLNSLGVLQEIFTDSMSNAFPGWSSLKNNVGGLHFYVTWPYYVLNSEFLMWDASCQWSSSLYFPLLYSDQMNIGRTHPTLWYRPYLRMVYTNWYRRNCFNPVKVVASVDIVTPIFQQCGF